MGAAQDLEEFLSSGKPCIPQGKGIAGPVGTEVREHGDDLVAVETLAHRNRSGVRVNGIVLVGQIIGGVGDCLLADTVQRFKEHVKL